MADDKKKSKIDLKARLGKTATMSGSNVPAVPLPVPGFAGPPGSAPPPAESKPSSPSGVPGPPVPAPSVRPQPLGIAPPPGMSPGIPLPPFAQQRRAEPAAPKPTAAQQTIKVEMGEEIVEERKKASKRAALFAVIAAVIGLVIGFVAGGSSEKGGNLKAAAKGAAILEKDVRAAGEKMKELDEKLKVAYEKLSPQGDAAQKMATRAFPDDLASALGGMNIPFDTTNLDNKPGENKQVGNLPGKVLRALLAYTAAVDDVNKLKDNLKSSLGVVKDPLLKSWKEEKDPVANYAVLFRADGANKTVADLVPIKEPFGWKGEFPANFTITKLENNKPAEKKATRWLKGDIIASDPLAIPVDPKSMAGFANDRRIAQLYSTIADILKALAGGLNPDDPANEKVGLIKQGEDLANQLHNASLNQ